MSSSLKSTAQKAFGRHDEIDQILAMPVTQLRLELKEAFESKKFSEPQYLDFVARLSALGGLGGQTDVAAVAVAEREVSSSLDIELNNEHKQLLWAAVLTRMMATGEEAVTNSKLWKQLTGSIGLHNEGITVANIIVDSLQNPDVTFDWGYPGSWFYRDPKNNHMNFDLYFMLLTGFEHVRAVELHEMGHSDLSVAYPPSMQKLYEKVTGVIDPRMISKAKPDDDTEQPKQKKVKKTKREQVDLALLVREWNMRQRSWNMMEDITVDQYAINWSDRLPQDFGYSLNHVATDLRGYGEIIMGKDIVRPVHMLSDKAPQQAAENEKRYQEHVKRLTQPLTNAEVKDIRAGNISVEVAAKMFEEIQRATLLAGYVKNGLFADVKENWERFRIFTQDIARAVDISHLPDAKGRNAFDYLFDVCAEGPDSIRLLQPKSSDRFLVHEPHTNLKDSYRAVVAETNAQRNQIMEMVWDVYLKPFADVLLKDYEQKVEQKLDEQQKQQQQQQQQKDGQQGDGQKGQGQKGQGQKSQSQKSQSQGGGSSGDGDPESGGDDEEMDLDDDIENEIGDMSETPDDDRAKQGGGQGQDQDQQNDPDAADNKDGNGQGKDADADEKDGEKAGGPGWDAPKDDGQPKNPKRAGDVKNQAKIDDRPMSNEQKQAMKEKIKNLAKPDAGKLNAQAGHQQGLDLSDLAKGDWRDFNRRMIELSPVVNRLAESYKRIREEQKRQVMRESKNLNFMAEDGDIMARLDQAKMLQTKFRQASGQKITIDDFKKFREDAVHEMHSTIEMIYMIDGSGSMPSVKLANGVSAMEAALQSAAIGYMACRKAGIDSYIIMWGDKKPRVIATPGADLKTVGKHLEALRNGTGSGTDLAPGIVSTIEKMAKHRNHNGTISGSSHILVFSDGDIGDAAASDTVLEFVSRNAKNLSIDVAVLKNGTGETAMERVFNNVIERTGDRLVGIIRGDDPKQIPLDMARLMLKRVRSFKIKSEPDSKKRDRLRQLHKKIR